MKLSELIRMLQFEMDDIGDVELYTEYNDGRSTCLMRLEEPRWRGSFVKFEEAWKGHPDGFKYVIKI